MGTRWVSPPTYVSSGKGGVFTLDARVSGVDGAGQAIRNPSWLPAEPDMVAVSPHEGNEVEITVLRAGRSALTVTGGGAAKQLLLDVVEEAGTWRVSISAVTGDAAPAAAPRVTRPVDTREARFCFVPARP